MSRLTPRPARRGGGPGATSVVATLVPLLLLLLLLAVALVPAPALAQDQDLTSTATTVEVLGCGGSGRECENGGICKEDECICAGGWAGSYCQTKSALALPPLKVVIGFVVIAITSWKIGTFVTKFGLPIITGYLFTGILAGRFVLNIVPDSSIRKLDFVDEVSLAFIVLAAGGKLAIKELKGRGKALWLNVVMLLILDYAFALIVIFGMSSVVGFMDGMSGNQILAVAALVGTIMVARSPASAIAVVQEVKAKGPFTNLTLGVTVVMDLVVIILFSINVLMLNAVFEDPDGAEAKESGGMLFLQSIARMLLSCGFGGALGKFIIPPAVWGWTGCVAHVKDKRALKVIDATQTLIFILINWVVFIIEQYSREWLDSLLIVMSAGIVLANFTGRKAEFLHILHVLAPYVFLLFFTITGAALDFSTFASAMGLSVVLFFVRIFGLFLASYLGGRAAGEPENFNRYAGFTYITQAGVAMGLAKQVHTMFPGWGSGFATTIVTAVVFSQIMGPPLHKWALRSTGEATVGPGVSLKGTLIVLSDAASAQLARAVEGLIETQGWKVDHVHVSHLAAQGRRLAADVSRTVSESKEPSGIARAPKLSDPDMEIGLRAHFDKTQTAVLVMVDEKLTYEMSRWVDFHFNEKRLVVVARQTGDQPFGREPSKGTLVKSVAANFKMHSMKKPSKVHNPTRTMGMGDDEHKGGKRIPGVNFDFSGDEEDVSELLPGKTNLVHVGMASAQYLAEIVIGQAGMLLDVEPREVPDFQDLEGQEVDVEAGEGEAEAGEGEGEAEAEAEAEAEQGTPAADGGDEAQADEAQT